MSLVELTAVDDLLGEGAFLLHPHRYHLNYLLYPEQK